MLDTHNNTIMCVYKLASKKKQVLAIFILQTMLTDNYLYV